MENGISVFDWKIINWVKAEKTKFFTSVHAVRRAALPFTLPNYGDSRKSLIYKRFEQEMKRGFGGARLYIVAILAVEAKEFEKFSLANCDSILDRNSEQNAKSTKRPFGLVLLTLWSFKRIGVQSLHLLQAPIAWWSTLQSLQRSKRSVITLETF